VERGHNVPVAHDDDRAGRRGRSGADDDVLDLARANLQVVRTPPRTQARAAGGRVQGPPESGGGLCSSPRGRARQLLLAFLRTDGDEAVPGAEHEPCAWR